MSVGAHPDDVLRPEAEPGAAEAASVLLVGEGRRGTFTSKLINVRRREKSSRITHYHCFYCLFFCVI